MKLFDVDWTRVLRELPRYERLSFGARRTLLTELKTNGYAPASLFGAYLDEIIASGIPNSDPARSRLWLNEQHHGLLKVLRAMHRHPLFDDPNFPALLRYMEEHFSAQDMVRVASAAKIGNGYAASKYQVAQRVAFAGWTGDLLAAKSDQALLQWATKAGYERAAELSLGPLPELKELQLVARELVAHPDGLPLKQLLAGRTDEERDRIASSLDAGFRTLVLFGGMRSRDLEPMVGLWPDAARELSRPPAPRPVHVDVVDSFTMPVQLEDMTTMLAAVAASPVRLRANDLRVFAKANAEIRTRLVTLPEWVGPCYTPDDLDRVDLAAQQIDVSGFAMVKARNGNPHLEVTAAGERWLKLGAHERLAFLVDRVRKAKDMNPDWAPSAIDLSDRFFPYSTSWMFPKGVRLRVDIVKAFRSAENGFLRLNEFLEYASRHDNALQVVVDKERMQMLSFDGRDPRDGARVVWHNMLLQFLISRLLPLGGASLGRDASGAICFRLTDIGAYMLGIADTYEAPKEQRGALVVQPNFDVVFLGSAPASEAVVARIAQRIGPIPGAAFRLTRASILKAAEAGRTSDDILDVLGKVSSRPVPQNVQREIAGWIASVRRATVRTVQVIECADEESAARVRAIIGSKSRQLTSTMLELSGTPAVAAATIKRLRENGVFVDEPADVPARKKGRARRM